VFVLCPAIRGLSCVDEHGTNAVRVDAVRVNAVFVIFPANDGLRKEAVFVDFTASISNRPE
jgi:hypothetical protein